MRKALVFAAFLLICVPPHPPAGVTPPQPGCVAELQMVDREATHTEPCEWMWRCGDTLTPFQPRTFEPGCSKSFF